MPGTRRRRCIKKVSRFVIVARPAARSGRKRSSVRVSAPNIVPFVVTNRTGKQNRAVRVPVVHPCIAACHADSFPFRLFEW
jgi:hypothetical protein